MRKTRKFDDKKTSHYIIRFRCHRDLPPWGEDEKNQFQLILKGSSSACLIEVMDYAIVGDEAVVLVKVPPASLRKKLTDGQVLHLMKLLKGDTTVRLTACGLVRSSPKVMAKYRRNLEKVRSNACDLSNFCKIVGQRFGVWHAKKHSHQPVWRDRFSSELLPNDHPDTIASARTVISKVLKDSGKSAKTYPWCAMVKPMEFCFDSHQSLPEYTSTPKAAVKTRKEMKAEKEHPYFIPRITLDTLELIRRRMLALGRLQEKPVFTEVDRSKGLPAAPPTLKKLFSPEQEVLLKKTIATKSPGDFGLDSGGFSQPWNVFNVALLCRQLFDKLPDKPQLRRQLIEWAVMRAKK